MSGSASTPTADDLVAADAIPDSMRQLVRDDRGVTPITLGESLGRP